MKQRINKGTLLKSLSGLCAVTAVMMTTIVPANAGIIYSNDFETNSNGFSTTATGILPSDTVGGTSRWLGGDRSLFNGSGTVLTLTGLTIGSVYDLAFDLYLGGTWDGSGSFGPDYFQLQSSSDGFLVNATFVNDFPMGLSGKTQTYSDATPLGNGGEHTGRSGVDVARGEPIYYFGHGAGNPMLSFTAASMTESLTFISFDYQGIADEIFALDNVVVSSRSAAVNTPSVPEPAPLALLGLGLMGLGISRKRRT